jgi:hypothetical protein
MSFRKFGQAIVLTSLAALSMNAKAFTIDDNVEGFWYQPNVTPDPRRGWGFQYLPTGPEAGVLFVAGYVYDSDGNATWLVGQAPVTDGQFEVDLSLQALAGGVFGPGSGAPVASPAGSLNVVFNTCHTADFTFTGVPGVQDYSQEWTAFLDIVEANDEGSCVYQKEFESCPSWSTPAVGVDRACVISGTVTEDITLTNDTLWLLNGGVFVGAKANQGDPVPENGPTMYIEAGTRIQGLGIETDVLVVSRGSRIVAEGQPHAPIVMTGPYTATDENAGAGNWGGLVINGAAPINEGIDCQELNPASPCEALGEGDSGYYGGVDPNDSSGVLRYVRVQFAGQLFSSTNELNGIAFQGVGNGTVVDYVQVHSNADDGVEFFGGTVNVKHLVITAAQDDSIDWTQGYTGRIQYALVVQNQDETVDTDKGMEMDNNGGAQDNLPRAQPRVANITIIGKAGETGMNARAGTGGNFSNMIVVGCQYGFDLDEASTFEAAGGPGARTGVLTMENTILDCNTNIRADDEGGPDPWSVQEWFDEQPGNMEVDPMLVDGVFPPADAGYTTGYPLDPTVFDDFFEDVDYIGAFRSREQAWHYKWTEFLGN